MDRKIFFNAVRGGLLGPNLSNDEVSGCNAILDAMGGAPIAYCAYALATAYLETAHSMQPVQEAGGANYFFRKYDIQGANPSLARELGNIHPGDGVKYCGRGLVQLTGLGNYTRATKEIGVDLVTHPERALEADIAAKVMRRGMSEGWFTGLSFRSRLPATGLATVPQFVSARGIINGQDRAGEIAGYATAFQADLTLAGW